MLILFAFFNFNNAAGLELGGEGKGTRHCKPLRQVDNANITLDEYGNFDEMFGGRGSYSIVSSEFNSTGYLILAYNLTSGNAFKLVYVLNSIINCPVNNPVSIITTTSGNCDQQSNVCLNSRDLEGNFSGKVDYF
jgi:hypothetical protein